MWVRLCVDSYLLWRQQQQINYEDRKGAATPAPTKLKRRRRRLIIAVTAEVLIVTAGVVVYGIGGSVTILAGALFVPPTVACSLYLYGEWVKNDYQWYSPRGQRRVRNYKPPAESTPTLVSPAGTRTLDRGATADKDDPAFDPAKANAPPPPAKRCGDSGVPLCGKGPTGCFRAWVSGDFRRVDFCCAFWRCGATNKDYKRAAAATTIFVCLLLFAIIVGNGWESAPWIGPAVSLSYAILVTTILPIIAWFNTFEVTIFVVGSPIMSLLMHFFGLLTLWQAHFDGDTELKGAACLLALVGYPAVVVLGLALCVRRGFCVDWLGCNVVGMGVMGRRYLWRDDKWKLGKTVIGLFIVSQVLLLGFAIGVTFVDIFAGVALLTLYVLSRCYSTPSHSMPGHHHLTQCGWRGQVCAVAGCRGYRRAVGHEPILLEQTVAYCSRGPPGAGGSAGAAGWHVR